MKPKEKRFLYLSLLISVLTGAGMVLLDVFFKSYGDFGFEEHWLLDDVKMIHYLAAPFLSMAFGLLWQGHIRKGIRDRRSKKKISGIFILAVMLILVLSGQFLLSLVSDFARYWVSWVHILAGCLIVAGVGRHVFSKKHKTDKALLGE